jgi:TPP-dependent pyruvate/acetoin dehydrogenase alpha subunit
VAQIKLELAKEIEDAVTFAEQSPEPKLEEMFTDIYAPF